MRQVFSRSMLMCRNHEVAEFVWSGNKQAVAGKVQVINARYLPLCCFDFRGAFTKAGLTQWFKDRGIPDMRPEATEKLLRLGYRDVTDIMANGFGLSLSDQYWIRPQGSTAIWEDINCFANDFPEEFGELMLPHDKSSIPKNDATVRAEYR